MKRIINKIISYFAEKKNKWTLFIYLNNQCICKRKIEENFEPMKEHKN